MQLRYSRLFAPFLPAGAEVFDLFPLAVVDPWGIRPFFVSLLFCGEEQISHIAFQNRDRPTLTILSLVWLQRDNVAFKIHLRPLNVSKLTLSYSRDVAGNK